PPSSSTPSSSSCSSRWRCAAGSTGRSARRRCCAGRCSSTASEASSRRSPASRSSTSPSRRWAWPEGGPMREHLLPALRTTAVTLVLTGLLYPVAVTGAAQLLFRERANGSLVRDERGNVVGSELIAQGFAGAAYFQPRPSAAGDKG